MEDVGGFLTGEMEDRVIPDVMNHVFLPQGRYPENFVLISQLEVCQAWGVKKGGTWRTFRVSDMVILNVMDVHILAIERYPENFVLISLLEVC